MKSQLNNGDQKKASETIRGTRKPVFKSPDFDAFGGMPMAVAFIFPDGEVTELATIVWPLRALVAVGARLRGNVLATEQLLARYVTNHGDREADATLEWIDVRDLVAVARTTLDARLFAEIERRIERRGKYQRGRAANVLGFSVRTRAPLAATG